MPQQTLGRFRTEEDAGEDIQNRNVKLWLERTTNSSKDKLKLVIIRINLFIFATKYDLQILI